MDQDDKRDDAQAAEEAPRHDRPEPRLTVLQMVAIGVIIFALGLLIYSWLGPKKIHQVEAPKQLAKLPDGPLEANAIDPTGPHKWEIDGQKFSVRQTYWLERPGGLLYLIEYNPGVPVPDRMTMTQVAAGMFPLIQHAYQKDLYKRADARNNQPTAIAVLLIDVTGEEPRWFPIALSIKDIAMQIALLKQAETRPALLAPEKPRPLESFSPAAQEFFTVLAQLAQNKTLLAPEGLDIVAGHLPAMLALTDDDMLGVHSQRFFPFVVLISRMAVIAKHQDYVLQHFDEIAHWRIKLTWAVTLFTANRKSPAVLEYIKSAAHIPSRDAMLRKLFADKYDSAMNSILNPTTGPAMGNVEEPATAPATQPVK